MQLLPKLGRVLGSPERIDLPPERVDGGVDLEHAGRDGLRGVLLAADEIAPAGFQILKAHPPPIDLAFREKRRRPRRRGRRRRRTGAIPAESGGDYGANRAGFGAESIGRNRRTEREEEREREKLEMGSGIFGEERERKWE